MTFCSTLFTVCCSSIYQLKLCLISLACVRYAYQFFEFVKMGAVVLACRPNGFSSFAVVDV